MGALSDRYKRSTGTSTTPAANKSGWSDEDRRLYHTQAQKDAGRPWYTGDAQKEAAFADQEKKRKAELARQKTFKSQLGQLDVMQSDQFQKLTRGFRTATQIGAGQQMRGLELQAAQAIQRQGISSQSPMALALQQTSSRGLSNSVQNATNQFTQRLAGMQAQNREAFVLGKFSFFDSIDRMYIQADIEKDLMYARAQIQQDQQSRNGWMNFVTTLGAVGLSIAFPPAAPAIAGATAVANADGYGSGIPD